MKHFDKISVVLGSVFFIFLLFLGNVYLALGQNGNPRQIHIKRAIGKIQIDGHVEEKDWEGAEVAKDFNQYFPFDSSLSIAKTEVRLTYDEHFIYFSAVCHHNIKGKFITNSLRRDYRSPAADGISFVIDPFQDHTNGFFFGTNPFGVQREGLIANGGTLQTDLSLSWDNKWYSEAKITENGWTVEMAIPFKTLRFKEGSTIWKVNFYRIDSKYNERSVWSHVPRNFQLYSLAYTGELVWDEPLKKPSANVAVIPFITGGVSKNHLAGTPQNTSSGIGGDAKIGVTPSLNLDLTINPDFSQVEVDRQVTNLDRFEIFFPERRQFFLENADLFSDFGNPRIRPFFSRRIGIAIDKNTGQNLQNPIWFGARLSGRLDKNWRVGLMNMQTARDASIKLPSYNYTVAAIQRKVFSRSNIGGIFVNKENFATAHADSTGFSQYNRLMGLDYNLASADNTWTGKFFYHQTMTSKEQANNEQFAHGASLVYSKPHIRVEWNHQMVGRSFDAQVGYVPRRDFKQVNPIFVYFFFPKSKLINRINIYSEFSSIWNGENLNTDRGLWLGLAFRFQNTAELAFWWARNYTYLFFPFDPTNTGGNKLAQGTAYTYNSFNFEYTSDQRKNFFLTSTGYMGEYFNGNRFNLTGTLNYRLQPYVIFSLDYTYNRLRFPEPYSSADLYLMGPKFDVTFSKSLFLTAYFQYNSQINNININTRFQWRFKPVSDLFIVYTDNYFADVLRVKNRGIVLKLTYWLNI
jgi:hypothetical protein